ncbi:MAG TPA: hypothetical protein VN612_08400 [Acidobacteriaceae bacterium]|nr:hypothetical protein [Acidobacteriaceae bacterium]
MQNFSSAVVRLLMALACILFLTTEVSAAAPPKVHTVVLGSAKKVAYTAPGAIPAKGNDAPTMKVRALIVDGRQKEWITGDAHDVTDRSFAVRRVMRVNDALPGDAQAKWSWQPGPWLLVDRTTGHVTALHLPDFDDAVSDAVWFRDYAAYCGIGTTAKGGLFAIVAQLGARRAVVQQPLGKWPQQSPASPVCRPAVWQREPMRVTFQLTGGAPMTFDVVGGTSLIEEGDPGDDQ